MNQVRVLIEGYAKKITNGWLASSTVTLVKSNGKNIIIDPGCNREKLLGVLAKEGLTTAAIHYVILTHNHTDHTLLAGIFENAKTLNSYEIYYNDNQVAHNNAVPGADLQLISTPGHTEDHISVFVKTRDGVYVIAGDLFWWMNDEEQKVDVEKDDQAHPSNKKQLIESRKKILDIADYIIPGHGKFLKLKVNQLCGGTDGRNNV